MMPFERTGAFTVACVAVVALVAASCSAERAQQESERKEIGRQLAAAYDSCVRTSFASMLPTMVDRKLGIDQAFRVCRTEEKKLQAFEESLPETRMSALRPWWPTALGSKKNSCGDSSDPLPLRTAMSRRARRRWRRSRRLVESKFLTRGSRSRTRGVRKGEPMSGLNSK
jgi:hypothetical protein